MIALSLYPGVGYQIVLRWLLTGLQWLGNHCFRVDCRESLSAARQRLGEQPVRKLHEEVAVPLADKSLPGSYFQDFLLVALDGCTLALQDTIKAKPRPKFPVRKRGTKPVTRTRQTTVMIC